MHTVYKENGFSVSDWVRQPSIPKTSSGMDSEVADITSLALVYIAEKGKGEGP